MEEDIKRWQANEAIKKQDAEKKKRLEAEREPERLRAEQERERERLKLDAEYKQRLAEQFRLDSLALWERDCPSEYKVSDWDHPDLLPFRKQIDRVRNWEPAKKGIVAVGPTGRAKTRSMWEMVRNQAEKSRRVCCWHATDWFGELQKQVKYGRDDALGFVKSCARSKILFIDDLGQEAVTAAREDWARDYFFRLLDIRVGEGLPLFITTNLRAEQIANPSARREELKTDPFLRRLMAVCDVVKFCTPEEAKQSRAA